MKKSKFEKSSLVQLATRTKRKINETVIGYQINLNGVNTIVDLNIIPLGSYDILIGMDWLEKHHVVLDFHNKTFTLNEEGKHSIMKVFPRPISIRDISSLQRYVLGKDANRMKLMWRSYKIPKGQVSNIFHY